MSGRNFKQLLETQWARGNFVCVGLDSDLAKIPDHIRRRTGNVAEALIVFNAAIVGATKDIVCAYKPNTAFYEAHGAVGWSALQETIKMIRRVAPDVPVILDAKRADIGNTNTGYAEMAFDYLEADAVTLHPYFGAEALEPFLARADKGIFVLCRTSNPGAGEFQNMVVKIDHSDPQEGDGGYAPLYLYVALRVAHFWNGNKNCGLVVGATAPEELERVRGVVGEDMLILIPGVGTQGGDVKEAVTAGKNSRGQGFIVNSSRSIIFASQEDDFAQVARAETIKLRNLVNQFR